MAIFYSKSTGGFYDDAIHTGNQIPKDVVSVSADQYQALLEGQAQGKLITADANGNPVLSDPPAPSLADVQATALKTIDADAETLRSVYITANSGQVATYILKYNEATAYKTAGYTGDVPGLVQSEVDATGDTPQAAADSIIAQYEAWSALAASIETIRRKAKIAVSAATTADDVNTAVTTAQAGFAQIQSSAGSAASN